MDIDIQYRGGTWRAAARRVSGSSAANCTMSGRLIQEGKDRRRSAWGRTRAREPELRHGAPRRPPMAARPGADRA